MKDDIPLAVRLVEKFLDLGYYSLKVLGSENFPRNTDRNIVAVANHSGWFALDAIMWLFATGISRTKKTEIPRIVVEDAFLDAPILHRLADPKLCIRRSALRNTRAAQGIKRLAIFPEGSDGNCKSFLHAYRMRQWKPGFVKIALMNRAIVSPTIILGGEESFPSLMPINIAKRLIGTALPWPMLAFPLPSNWEVHFLEPIDFGKYPESWSSDKNKVRELTQELYEIHQNRLSQLAEDRPLVCLGDLVQRLRAVTVI